VVVIDIRKLDVPYFEAGRVGQDQQLDQRHNEYQRQHLFISEDLPEFLLYDE
jgi:hypothetical protein